MSNDLSGATADLAATFTGNAAGQIASTTRTGDPYAWTGSAAVNRNFLANRLNQYTSAGPASFTYDARGNLTSDGSSSFGYSSQNQLVSATASGTTTSLAYDSAMRLYEVAETATTRFAYDGLDAIAEYDGSNTLLRRYVDGPGPFDGLLSGLRLASRAYAFSSVHCRGCWFSRAKSITWVTLVSATS